jgi:hypothetical protein
MSPLSRYDEHAMRLGRAAAAWARSVLHSWGWVAARRRLAATQLVLLAH